MSKTKKKKREENRTRKKLKKQRAPIQGQKQKDGKNRK